MRLFYIIIENINPKHAAQIQKVSKQIDMPEEELVQNLVNIDPSGKYTQWVLKQIRFKNVRIPEDNYRINQVLQNFTNVKQRLENKDINAYKRIHDLESALRPILGTGSKREGAFQVNPEELPGVVVANRHNKYTLYLVNDPESLKEMGEGTEWCTRRSYPDCAAESYLAEQPFIGIIAFENKPTVQFTPDFDQVMDVHDDDMSLHEFTPLLLPVYDDMVKMMVEGNKDDVSDEYVIADAYYQFARSVLHRRWPEKEEFVKLSGMPIVGYARNVIKGRWPEGEGVLLRLGNANALIRYAHEVLRSGWPAAEPIIATNPVAAYNYAWKIINGRWPEGEKGILKSPSMSYLYAWNILGKRWKPAEAVILKSDDSETAVKYARDLVGGRWHKAEPLIAKSPRAAALYAMHILDDRWLEAEETIKQDKAIWQDYAAFAKMKSSGMGGFMTVR